MNENESCNMNHAPDLIPAAKQPCIECPFRTTNADMPAPQDWYTQDNFERAWAGVARENRPLPCHMFDSPEQTGFDSRTKEVGLHQPVNLGKPKECAGMAGMIHREVRIAAGYPDWQTYIAARPTGLQRKAYETALARLAGVGTPLTEPADPNSATLMDPAKRINQESLIWKLGDSGVVALLNTTQQALEELKIPTPPCDCRVCENHPRVHKTRDLVTATGATVQVDASLHPLLTALAATGITTTASCENLHDAMAKLWPEQIPVLQADDNPRSITYAAPLNRKEAVIRFENRNPAARAYLHGIRSLKDLHLSDGSTQAQLTFPLHMVPALTAAARYIPKEN